MKFIGHAPTARITSSPRSERERKARELLVGKVVVAVNVDEDAGEITIEAEDGSRLALRYQGPVTEVH